MPNVDFYDVHLINSTILPQRNHAGELLFIMHSESADIANQIIIRLKHLSVKKSFEFYPRRRFSFSL
ncbi:hypothetical protein L596_004073 [Steinernema carpocapsae]|uniref:Uncharacterized protein n=1 Tax=Steinernema carpocapsae TaxID=34508 RepID=A0A4U8UW69_STECR|nr:hypothetical protein L596_004073 [Steinernema carpocapsae]